MRAKRLGGWLVVLSFVAAAVVTDARAGIPTCDPPPNDCLDPDCATDPDHQFTCPEECVPQPECLCPLPYGPRGINCGNFQFAAGVSHACAVVAGNGESLPSDRIECWGNNDHGQVSPVPEVDSEDPLTEFLQVTTGFLHSCGLRKNGLVECWGDSDSNKLEVPPDGPGANDNFIQIDAGFGHTCGVHVDHSVACWGDNSVGESTPPPFNFLGVSAGDANTCGVVTNNTILCWGLASTGINTVPNNSNYTQVAVGGFHACGLHTNGSVECWGTDSGGNPAGTFSKISAGGSGFNCGLLAADSTVSCWGDNSAGQLDAPCDAYLDIDCGTEFSCALLGDGQLSCWGGNTSDGEANPPWRSQLCPICGNGVPEEGETCEKPVITPGNPPVLGDFDTCCSPTTCNPYRLSESHVCRDATGLCDAPEVCNGTSLDCPAPGPLRPAGAVCRLPVGSCDPEEDCTGTSDQCPPELPLLGTSVTCRDVTGFCDIPEHCTGSDPTCPTDAFVASTTVCRPSQGVCDLTENCSGTAAACPADAFVSHEITCRDADGACDAVEKCTGSSADCPSDGVLNGSTTCRTPTGICDAPEVCDSSSKDCPADQLRVTEFVCRPQAPGAGCDAPENCTGLTDACPPDLNKFLGATCRAAASVCDQAETCSGLTNTCPEDQFSSSTVLCRAAVDVCDVSENCTGVSNSCPANAFASSTTNCDDGLFCDGTDTCNGGGACSVHVGDPCPGPDGDNNCVESCNENADSCTTNDLDNSPCSDGNACSAGDICTAGVCISGPVTPCDDGDICTFDTCNDEEGCVHLPGIADEGCLQPGKAILLIKDSPVPDAKLLKWFWKKGETFDGSLFGHPDEDTDYALCIFDTEGGVPSLAGSYHIPAGEAWKVKPNKIRFVNKDAPPDGIYLATGKAVAIPGKSKVGVKGQGAPLELPGPASSNLFFFHDPTTVAQLRSSTGACWSLEFGPENFKKNDVDKVKAVIKSP